MRKLNEQIGRQGVLDSIYIIFFSSHDNYYKYGEEVCDGDSSHTLKKSTLSSSSDFSFQFQLYMFRLSTFDLAVYAALSSSSICTHDCLHNLLPRALGSPRAFCVHPHATFDESRSARAQTHCLVCLIVWYECVSTKNAF